MKKGLMILALIALIALAPLAFAQFVDLTGRVSSPAMTNVSLQIIGPPVLVLIEPLNQTYLQNTSLPLTFSVDDYTDRWYNLNNGANITITAPGGGITNITFDASEGSHTLNLFVNNSNGETSANVTFSVNITLLNIIYSEYNGTYRGNSTDFITYTYEQLRNLSNLTLENTLYGKIHMRVPIDVVNDSAPDDGVVDFDSATNVSQNSIFVNVSEMPNLDLPARLYFYNVSFQYPNVTVNGAACGAVCSNYNFSAGTGILSFDVSGFPGEFLIIAGTAPTFPPGGGGGAPSEKKLRVTPAEITMTLVQGKNGKSSLLVENIGDQALNVIVSQSNLGGFLTISGPSFTLISGQSRIVDLNFKADRDQAPGAYNGFIRVSADGISEIVRVIVLVQSSTLDFSLDMNVPDQYQKITPGMEIPAEMTIIARGIPAEGDMYYALKDFEGAVVYQSSERKMIINQTYIKTIPAPSDLPPGRYLLYATLSHGNAVAVASSQMLEYKIAPAPALGYSRWTFFVLALAILIALVWLILSNAHEKSQSPSTKEKTRMASARRALKKNDQLRFANLRLISRSS